MIEEHLKAWLLADAKAQGIKTNIDALKADMADAEKEAEAAKFAIQEEMAATGEYEINVAGEFCDYRIYFPTPRSSVKVASPDAVPDEFCKIERIPRLNDIKEYIGGLEEIPNWVTIEQSTPKLAYKLVKKNGVTNG